MTAPLPFEGRRVLVTGATKGIGEAIARRLAAQGASVLVAARDRAAVEALAGAINGEPVPFDVSEPASVEAAIAAAGPIDSLVNNAGADDPGYLTELSVERCRRILSVNLEGAIFCARAVLPMMQCARWGRIVNVASEAGRIGSARSVVYSAAKGGVIAMTKALARENARYGITVNAVAPGPIETALWDTYRASPAGERSLRTIVEATQLKRPGQPSEVAAAVAFFASEEAGYITGEVLGVSGGMGVGG